VALIAAMLAPVALAALPTGQYTATITTTTLDCSVPAGEGTTVVDAAFDLTASDIPEGTLVVATGTGDDGSAFDIELEFDPSDVFVFGFGTRDRDDLGASFVIASYSEDADAFDLAFSGSGRFPGTNFCDATGTMAFERTAPTRAVPLPALLPVLVAVALVAVRRTE